MSRVANNPVELPKGVEVTIGGSEITVKGLKGYIGDANQSPVELCKQEDNVLTFAARKWRSVSRAMSGTTRALVNNMVTGVSDRF